MTNTLLFRILTYIILFMLVFMTIGTVLGLSTQQMSLTYVLDGFAGSPLSNSLETFGEKLQEFKEITDSLVITDYTNSDFTNGLIDTVNYLSKAFFGMINLSTVIIQMFANVISFALYGYSVFLS